MTTDMLVQLLVSFAAIAMLTALAWGLGFRQRPRLDTGSAIDQAAAAIPGFDGRDVLLSADCRSGLVRGRGGQIVLVSGVGDGWFVRSVPDGTLRVGGDGVVHVPLGDPRLRLAQRALAFTTAAPLPAWLENAA